MLSFINCRIPSAEEEEIFQEGEVPLGCKTISGRRGCFPTDIF